MPASRQSTFSATSIKHQATHALAPGKTLVPVHRPLATHPPTPGLQGSPACSSWPQRAMWWIGSKILMRVQLQRNSVTSAHLCQQCQKRNCSPSTDTVAVADGFPCLALKNWQVCSNSMLEHAMIAAGNPAATKIPKAPDLEHCAMHQLNRSPSTGGQANRMRHAEVATDSAAHQDMDCHTYLPLL
jgi:hypothetical protein